MISRNTYDGPGWRIVQETEQIEVFSYSLQPDKRWQYTDKAGHEHRWGEGYPTLRWVSEMNWCHECQDDHDTGFYECPLCFEHITPGQTSDLPVRIIPGLTTTHVETADGRQIPLAAEDIERIRASGGGDALDREVVAILDRWRSKISR